MAAKKIGAIITLDGEKEFKQSVTNCNKTLTTLKSEMGLVKAQCEGQENSLESLTRKNEVLTRVLEEQRVKEREVRKGQEHAKDSYDAVGSSLDSLRKDLESAKKKMREMGEASDTSAADMDAQKKQVDELAQALSKSEKHYQTAGNRVKDWQAKLNTAEAQVIKASGAVNKNAAYMKEAESAADKCATSIDAFGKEIKEASDMTVSFGTVIKTNLVNTVVNVLKGAVTDAVSSVTELEDAEKQLQAGTGANTAEMKKYKTVMEEVNAGNFGESFSDVADATEKIRQTLGDMDASSLKDTAENAITLRDTFNFDYQEQLRAVKQLMDNFGIDSKAAYNLIAQGAQEGLNKNEDLLDTINEYAPYYAGAGLGADDFFNSLKNGAREGTFSVDKLGDAYKEFSIRAKDTTATTTEAYELLGLNADRMRAQFAAGGESAKAATDTIINSLFSMEDDVKRNQAGVGLFGTMWEDLGEKGVRALTNVNGSISSAKNAMEDIKKIKYDTLTARLEQVGKKFQTEIAVPIADKALPLMEEGLDAVIDNMDILIPLMGGMAAGAVVYKGAAAAVSIFTVSTEGATVAQAIFNTVCNANPIVLAASALMAAGTAFAIYTGNAGEASEEAEILSEMNDRVCDSANQTAEATGELIDSHAENTVQMQAQGKYAKTLAERIETLADKESLSNEEKRVMQEYLSELNGLVPELSLAYDEQSGKLSLTNDEIERYLENSQKEIEIQAAKEHALELIKMRTELEIEAIKLQTQSGELKQKTNDLLEKENDFLMKTGGTITWIAGKEDERKSYKELTEAQEENTEAIQTNEEAKKELEAEVAATQEVLTGYEVQWSSLTETERENSRVTTENAQMQQEAAEANAMAAQTIADAYTGMQEKVSEVVSGQMEMFEEFNAGAEISREQLLTNMQSQIDGVSNWADNMAVLADRGINQGILEKLAEMGPQASTYVQAFANMSDDELKKANEMWSRSLDMKSGVDESIQGMIGQYAVSVGGGKARVAETMKLLGHDTVQGLVQGINETKEQAGATAEELGDAVTAGTKESLDSHSPSRVFMGIGRDVVTGLVNGVEATKDSAGTAVSMMAKELVEKAQTILNEKDFSGIGRNIANSMASGMSAAKSRLINTAAETAAEVKKRLTDGLESRYFETAGRNISTGLGRGIDAGRNNVSNRTDGLADCVRAATDELDGDTLYDAGLNVSNGLASGIRAGESGVIKAISRVCQSAIREAREELDIHSPSKVFEQIGTYTAQGFGLGYENEMKNVNAVIAGSMDIPDGQQATGGIRNYAGEDGVSELLNRYLPYLSAIADKELNLYPSRQKYENSVAQAADKGMETLRRRAKWG